MADQATSSGIPRPQSGCRLASPAYGSSLFGTAARLAARKSVEHRISIKNDHQSGIEQSLPLGQIALQWILSFGYSTATCSVNAVTARLKAEYGAVYNVLSSSFSCGRSSNFLQERSMFSIQSFNSKLVPARNGLVSSPLPLDDQHPH